LLLPKAGDFRTLSDFMAQKRKAQEAFGGQNGEVVRYSSLIATNKFPQVN
jgi:hypothetical protein